MERKEMATKFKSFLVENELLVKDVLENHNQKSLESLLLIAYSRGYLNAKGEKHE